MPNKLTHLDIQTVGLVPRGADQDADIVLAKSADQASGTLVEGGPIKTTTEEPMTIDMSGLPEGVQKAIGGVNGAADALSQELIDAIASAVNVATAIATPHEPEVAPVVEAEPIVAKAATEQPAELAEFAKALESLKADNASLRKALDEELEAREIREKVDEVAKQFPSVKQVDALGAALFRMEKGRSTAEDAKLMAELLTTAYAATKESSLFKELGSAATDEASGDGVSRIEKMAKSYMDADPALTHAQAVAKAAKTPEGREAYISR